MKIQLVSFHQWVGTIIKKHESLPKALCGLFAILVEAPIKLHQHEVLGSASIPTSLIVLSGHGAAPFPNCLSIINHRLCPGRLRPSV